AFLDNVVTQTLVAEGNGVWTEYAGGYEDWLLQRPAVREEARSEPTSESKTGPAATTGTPVKTDAPGDSPPESKAGRQKERSSRAPTRLTSWEERELASLPDQIAAIEAR